MTERQTAIITGARGQDGNLLTRLLLDQGYRVVGTTRLAQPADAALEPQEMRECTLTDFDAIAALIADVEPDEIYNLAAFSTGSGMFDDPLAMGDINAMGPVRILEAIRQSGRPIRFCQASSSEMYGARSLAPQSETTCLDPRSPYGAAKQYAHAMAGVYRSAHGVFACSAILFNHESELRPEKFVTRKVTRAAARIAMGLDDHVILGDLEARRDWGYAGDYVAAMHCMMQAPEPGDYVVATGGKHSVRDLARIAFAAVGLDYRDFVRTDPAYRRPGVETDLVGDASRLRALGWRPSLTFEDMIGRMVHADLHQLKLSQTKGLH